MIRKALIIITLSLLAGLTSAEFVFARFDPLGAVYFTNRNLHDDATIPHRSGYIFKPGTVTLNGWSFTISADGTRHVPETTAGGPRVVFVGDSVTFGLGVSDAETWVNLVCKELRLDCINAGRASYAAANVFDASAEYPAACIVYLTISNDDQSRMQYSIYRHTPFRFAVAENLFWLFYRQNHDLFITHDLSAYDEAMTLFEHRLNTLLIAFDDSAYGSRVAAEYGAMLIPPYMSGLSFFDPHPDAEGNRQIADAVTPIIADWLYLRDCR